jgi:hypothetical protein
MQIIGWVLIILSYTIPGFFFYKAWFDPEWFRNAMTRQYSYTPDWWPVKRFALWRIQQRSWIWEVRLITTLALVAISAVLVYIVVASMRN